MFLRLSPPFTTLRDISNKEHRLSFADIFCLGVPFHACRWSLNLKAPASVRYAIFIVQSPSVLQVLRHSSWPSSTCINAPPPSPPPCTNGRAHAHIGTCTYTLTTCASESDFSSHSSIATAAFLARALYLCKSTVPQRRASRLRSIGIPSCPSPLSALHHFVGYL